MTRSTQEKKREYTQQPHGKPRVQDELVGGGQPRMFPTDVEHHQRKMPDIPQQEGGVVVGGGTAGRPWVGDQTSTYVGACRPKEVYDVMTAAEGTELQSCKPEDVCGAIRRLHIWLRSSEDARPSYYVRQSFPSGSTIHCRRSSPPASANRPRNSICTTGRLHLHDGACRPSFTTGIPTSNPSRSS